VSRPLAVGITEDVRRPDGSIWFDLAPLAANGAGLTFVRGGRVDLSREDVDGLDAIIVFEPAIVENTLADTRLLVIARLGVGYDRVDVRACTEAGVLVAITPDGVRRPLASGAMAHILALAHGLRQMDRQVRNGRWERFSHVGVGLAGRTLGLLGVGNVGSDLMALAEPWGMQRIAHDPYLAEAPPGVELVGLEDLFRRSDFLVVLCPLNDETRRLVNAERLALMKPTAFLVNVARGGIVDQAALTRALEEGWIAGAGLDVFESEPVDPGDPLLQLDNVLLSPHAVCLTDELFRLSGLSAAEAVVDVASGRAPRHLVNPEALDHPRLAHLSR
jgi:phosphoglycerate dehydrogenase-like enzyme